MNHFNSTFQKIEERYRWLNTFLIFWLPLTSDDDFFLRFEALQISGPKAESLTEMNQVLELISKLTIDINQSSLFLETYSLFRDIKVSAPHIYAQLLSGEEFTTTVKSDPFIYTPGTTLEVLLPPINKDSVRFDTSLIGVNF